MKKILFLRAVNEADAGSDINWTALRDACAPLLGDEYQAEISRLSDLVYLVDGEDSRIWDFAHGWDVADFDLVIFQRVGGEVEKAIAAAHYLHAKHVAFIDGYLLRQGKDKLAGSFMHVANGFPVPRTFFASSEIYKQVFKSDAPFPYPFILKADNGRKGKDNYLIHSYAELVDTLDANKHLMMIAQEFIPNDGDLRVLVFNGKVKRIIHRQSKNGSHLNNTSQGGTADLIALDTIDRAISDDCERITHVEQLQVAGVDVVIDKNTGRYYFLEVNRAPQLTSGAFVDEKVAAYVDMVRSLVDSPKKPGQAEKKELLGRVERLRLADYGVEVPARIDSGARTSAIWASNIHLDQDGHLHFQLFDKQSQYFTGEDIVVKEYQETVVASSTGHVQERYKVKLKVVLHKRKINASFTLADRSAQVYPVLVGRNLLRGKFLVDVAEGRPLFRDEKLRTKSLRKGIRE